MDEIKGEIAAAIKRNTTCKWPVSMAHCKVAYQNLRSNTPPLCSRVCMAHRLVCSLDTLQRCVPKPQIKHTASL